MQNGTSIEASKILTPKTYGSRIAGGFVSVQCESCLAGTVDAGTGAGANLRAVVRRLTIVHG